MCYSKKSASTPYSKLSLRIYTRRIKDYAFREIYACSLHSMEDISASRSLLATLTTVLDVPGTGIHYRTNQMVVTQASDELKRNAEQSLTQQAEAESARVVSYLNDAVIRGQMLVQVLQFQKFYAEENLLSSEVLRGHQPDHALYRRTC